MIIKQLTKLNILYTYKKTHSEIYSIKYSYVKLISQYTVIKCFYS